MSEILNDENVMAELEQKVKDFEQEIKDFEQKRRDLEQIRRDFEQERRDLDQKKWDLSKTGEVIEDYEHQMEGINLQIEQTTADIREITFQIVEKGEKMKAIGNEILNAPETSAAMTVPPAPPVPPAEPDTIAFDNIETSNMIRLICQNMTEKFTNLMKKLRQPNARLMFLKIKNRTLKILAIQSKRN